MENELRIAPWYQDKIRYTREKVVVKILNQDGSFRTKINVPTAYYPLEGPYEVFQTDNTQAVEDTRVLDIFDSVKYRVGQCYSNTLELTAKLCEDGYNARSYAGWLFTGETEIPIHHAWTVLNGNQVLDLADDWLIMLSGSNGETIRQARNQEELREMLVSFQLAAKEYPNRIRCQIVGKPAPMLLYVGCPCDPVDAARIYRNLMRQYPNHECERNCDAAGWNPTQKLMHQHGLM